MDFQTHLYELGELEQHLQGYRFTSVTVYSSYEKVIAKNNHTEMFLYECSFKKKGWIKMIVLITGASHTGKTALLKSCLKSINFHDHLKMGLIHSGKH